MTADAPDVARNNTHSGMSGNGPSAEAFKAGGATSTRAEGVAPQTAGGGAAAWTPVMDTGPNADQPLRTILKAGARAYTGPMAAIQRPALDVHPMLFASIVDTRPIYVMPSPCICLRAFARRSASVASLAVMASHSLHLYSDIQMTPRTLELDLHPLHCTSALRSSAGKRQPLSPAVSMQ